MNACRLSRAAGQDLLEIIDWIAAANPDAAIRMRDRLDAAFTRLAARPGLGHLRNDLVAPAAGVRFWPVGRYLVIYRPAVDGIDIVRVLSGYRDIASLLAPGRRTSRREG